jgi:DoxX-like family
MNVALWIVASLLALFFLFAGITKTTRSKDHLRPMMGWVDDFPLGMVRFIGAVELAGAIGLVLPAATGIATVLTPLAATGIAIIMVGGGIVHLRRGEGKLAPMNVILLALAVFVAWGRFGAYSL